MGKLRKVLLKRFLFYTEVCWNSVGRDMVINSKNVCIEKELCGPKGEQKAVFMKD